MAMGAGLRPSSKVLDSPSDPNARAPQIYPDNFPKIKAMEKLRPQSSFPH